MKKPRTELIKEIKNKRKEVATNKAIRDKIYDELLNKYNIPINVSFDIIATNSDLSSYSDFILFCILSEINNDAVNVFYTEEEIKFYKNSKFEQEDKIEFPIVFDDMTEIGDDQWDGKITAKYLVKLSHNRLINYNENTQRTLRKVVKGNVITYEISLNKKNVIGIRNSMKNGTYIPTTITLNIPENSNFYYSPENHKLVIENMDHFDILDGYHRFVAMSQLCNEDPNFDYNMELRIVNFPESKAQHFIFQENQKSQMKKIDANSMNINNAANIVAKRLNDDPLCYAKGMIGRNDSIIPVGTFTHFIDRYYFKKINRNNERSEIVRVTKEVREKLNYLYESKPELFNKPFSNRSVTVMVFLFANENVDIYDIPKKFDELMEITKDKESEFSSVITRSNKITAMLSSLIESRE